MDINPHSEVLIIKTQYAILLLVKKQFDSPFYLFTINTFNGSIAYDGIDNSSVFKNKRDAISFIQKRYDFSTNDVIVLKALIGMVRFGKYLYILSVKKCNPITRIQNRHTIFQIEQVKYLTIELPFYPPLTTKQNRKITRLIQFPITEHHFWCESTDVTTPIFSNSHNNSFVWNNYWKQPFIELGVEDVCINLLQGTAITQILPFLNNTLFLKFSLITIRESVNGGTRYNARGIDENNHPGNEVQCELIVESNKGDCWSHVWRRGSVPVEWESVLAKNFPSVSIEISANSGDRTHFYFENLHKFFSDNILCVNLLHCQIEHSEFPLCKAYYESISSLPGVKYFEYDWHHEVKSKGISEALKGLYSNIDNPKFGYEIQFTHCKEEYTSEPINQKLLGQQIYDISSIFFKNEEELPPLNSFSKKQTNLCRVNCMDSLDRTNVGCFFYCCKVVSIILNQLGLIQTQPNGISTYEELMELIPLNVRQFLCKAFVNIGDCVSAMYTNTPACMTEIFFSVAQLNDPTQQNLAKPMNDSSIAVKRRYHNFLTDKTRQKVYNLFLGKYLDKMAPNINCGHTPSCVSIPPAARFMPPTVTIVDHNMFSQGYISQKQEIKTEHNFDPTHLLQMAPFSTTIFDSTTFLMVLSRYTYVRDICLVLVPSEFAPSAVKISFSLTYGLKLPLIPRTALPTVYKPTPIMIKVPPDFANHIGSLPQRFLFFEFEAGQKISLSNIFIFGEPYKKSNDSFYNFIYQKIDSDIKLFDNNRNLIDLNSEDSSSPMTQITPNDYLKQFPQKKLTFNDFIQYEICRLRNGMGRLESIALAAQSGFNPFDFSIKIHRKRNLQQGEFACCVCSKPSTWQCYECQRCFCSSNSCSAQRYHKVGHSNIYDHPVILCDVCFGQLVDQEKSLRVLCNEYKRFFSYINKVESDTSEFVENWLKSFKNGGEVIFNSDPTYYPSAFFQNPSDPRFNYVLTETGAVTIHYQKPKTKQNDEEEVLFSNNTTGSDGLALNFYQSQDLLVFLGKPMQVNRFELRGSNDLDVEIYNSDGSHKIYINSTTSNNSTTPRRKTAQKVAFNPEVEHELNDIIMKSSDDSDNEVLSLKSISNSTCHLLYADNSDKSDSDREEIPELNDSSIENQMSSLRMSQISTNSLMNVTRNVDPASTSSYKLFSQSTDLTDSFFTLKIKCGSFSYFHMSASDPTEVVFRRDSINGRQDYNLFPPKPINIKKNVKFANFNKKKSSPSIASVKSSSLLSKFGTKLGLTDHNKEQNLTLKQSSEESSSSLYIDSQSLIDCQTSSEFLIKKMTFSIDFDSITKVHGIIIEGSLGIHAILVSLFYRPENVKIIPYYLPIFDKNQFILKFWSPQNVMKIYIQVIDFSRDFLKEPKFSAF